MFLFFFFFYILLPLHSQLQQYAFFPIHSISVSQLLYLCRCLFFFHNNSIRDVIP